MYTPKKCAFCGRPVYMGDGIMLILNDGSSRSYCSSKCRLNDTKLRRDPRKFKWARQGNGATTPAAARRKGA